MYTNNSVGLGIIYNHFEGELLKNTIEELRLALTNLLSSGDNKI